MKNIFFTMFKKKFNPTLATQHKLSKLVFMDLFMVSWHPISWRIKNLAAVY